ncbi:MAG TPA: ATP-binding protein [Kofleriaceae bacterium]
MEPDAISVVELGAGGQTTRLPIRDARAIAAFAEQLWVATHDDQLARIDLAGRPLGPVRALPFAARAMLQPAPCGPPAAVWSSSPALALIDDFGQLATAEIAEVDVALPLTGRRIVTARGAKLTLPSGLVAKLPPNTTVLDGAVMVDGKSVTLLAAHAGSRQLVAVSLGTGQITQRCTVPSTPVRIATRRSLAIVQLEPRVLWVLDFHAGRELGAIRFDHDVNDFAIDPGGHRLAVHSVTGAIELHPLVDLLRRPAASTQAASDDPDERATEAPASDVQMASTAESGSRTGGTDREPSAHPTTTELRTPFVCPSLIALDPRSRPAETDRSEARRQLDSELRRVALWTLGAIAAAWDSRKLGYGNEGKHPYELEVGAILGMNRGFAGDYLAAAKAQLAEHEHAIAGDVRWRALDTPVGAMTGELALDPLAVDIVLVIAAAALWGEIARLYGILANDAGRATVDELLVQQVLEARHDRHSVAAALDPRGQLVRLGIVHIAGKRARPFAELTVDPVVLDRLRAVEPDLGPATAIRTTDRDLASLDIARGVLASAVAALARPRPSVDPSFRAARIAVRGRVGSGRRTLSCALAARAGRDLAVIDALALPRAPDLFAAELQRSLRRAQLIGLVPCIAHLGEVTFDERPARDVAAEPLRLHPGPIFVIASPDETVPFGPGHTSIELPVLAETERRAVWTRALAEASIAVADIDALAARYKIGPGVIRQAVAAARDAAGVPDGDASPAIEAYIRQTRDTRLGQYARRVARLASWSNVVFPPDILDSLRELVARVRHGRQVYETWGMTRTMATSRGLTALFQGPPGTGKTLVAGVIARELGLDLYQVDLSKVMSKWIGETERNLATIFDAAEDGQVILLFDEADSLFARRTEVRSSNDRYANLEVNYLLQRLDAFEGIAILTTNSGNSIDQAFKRRLSFRLSFPFPDEETREQLWRAHLPPELPIAGTLTLDALARKYQLSGGYIRNACLRAAFLAAQEETALHQHHLERAVALEFAELGKLSTTGTIA